MHSFVDQTVAIKNNPGSISFCQDKTSTSKEERFEMSSSTKSEMRRHGNSNGNDDKALVSRSGWHDFSTLAILPVQLPGIQAKLKINAPGDKYEQEADRIAEQVMRMPAAEVEGVTNRKYGIQRKCAACESGGTTCPKCTEEEKIQLKPLASQISPLIQQQSAMDGELEEEEEVLQTKSYGQSAKQPSSDLTNRIQSTQGGGMALDTGTRQFMEPRFGADFSRVRIHSDKQAAEMNREINARAFTVGRDIYFNSGAYNPRSAEGKKLLAHELTHVLQQNGTNRAHGSQNTHPTHPSGLGIQRQANPQRRRPTPINSNTTLTSDQTNGIRITANNITLDCDGHTLSGSGSGTPIELNNRRGVTVRNCIIDNFNEGIRLRRSNNNTISDNTVRNNRRDGIDLNFSNSNTFSGNTLDGNNLNGIELDDSNRNRIISNVINNNGENISLDRSNRNTFRRNSANSSNTDAGIHLDQTSTRNTFNRNVANNNNTHGIRLDDDCINNNFTRNTANNNTRHGFVIDDRSHRNTFERNTANDNQRDGFHIENSNNNIFNRNTANNNNDDNIDIDNSTGNRCNGNSFTHRRCRP